MRKVWTFTIITLFSICFSLLSTPYVTAAADDEKAISMDVSPQNALYDINNMKPGDWAPRTVTIENKGGRDFNYLVEIDHHGSDKLFRELLMEVEAGSEKIYDGKVADFTDLSPRELKAGQTETLEFTIRFPEYLGNDYQGLHTRFSLMFSAADTEDDNLLPVTAKGNADGTHSSESTNATLESAIGSDGDTTLPKTATNIFNFLIVGSILAIIGVTLAATTWRRKKA